MNSLAWVIFGLEFRGLAFGSVLRCGFMIDAGGLLGLAAVRKVEQKCWGVPIGASLVGWQVWLGGRCIDGGAVVRTCGRLAASWLAGWVAHVGGPCHPCVLSRSSSV